MRRQTKAKTVARERRKAKKAARKQKKAKKLTAFAPQDISRHRKKRYLLTLSEDAFRDRVVRPIFLKLGYSDGRDLCGVNEEGKDAIFVEYPKIGPEHLVVVQTKKGNLNLSSRASESVVRAATQISTALATKVSLLESRKRILPYEAWLCASGTINTKAIDYIMENVDNPHIQFLDADSLIPLVDKHYPEFWFGIDADRFPYLRKLKDAILESSDTITLKELGIDSDVASPVTDEMYVSLYLHRYIPKRVKRSGQVHLEPELEQFPVEGVLKRRERLIHIVGDPGSGKTTVLRRLAYSIAEKSLSHSSTTIIPVIIRARDLAAPDSILLDELMTATKRLSGVRSNPFSDEDLRKGNVLVLVDALDEAMQTDRTGVVQKILQFNAEYPECRIILTSRNYLSITRLAELSGFTRYYLTPINLTQAKKIIQRLHTGKTLPETTAQEMLRRLHEVHGMELNPLLVTVFVATSDYSRRDIPANITELFKKFTEMMLGRWDQKKGLAQQYHAPVKDYLLKALAFEMHNSGTTKVLLDECKEFIQERLQETGHEADLEILFEEAVIRSGLFIIDGEEVRFRHHLLQEFFAGRAVESASFFQTVHPDDWWKNSMVFYFGENPSKHSELSELCSAFGEYEGLELYRAAVAIGLATQACYLSRIADKQQTMDWVMHSLARSRDEYLVSQANKGNPLPLTAFLSYYLYARDSVACDALWKHAAASAKQALQMEKLTHQEELKAFWCLVSLVETGHLRTAKELIAKFNPAQIQLLLALHLGCFLVANLPTYSSEDKRIATKTYKSLDPKIVSLREEVLQEMSSLLLEVRQGRITALEAPCE